jgi:quercetin dioxygenase-like cupin family protein
MRVSSREEAPALSRGDGLVSRLLHSGDVPGTALTVTWVEVEPGSSQVLHSHDPEQVYVVLAGEGRVTVGDDRERVVAGDLVHIPSNTEHGVENTGEETLEYVSAATPTVPTEDLEEFYG